MPWCTRPASQILPFPHINYQLKTSRPADRAFVKLLKITLLVICGVLVASIFMKRQPQTPLANFELRLNIFIFS
nr:hypothetical protein Iba_chr13fCG11670 [Ipomoea batatas]